MNTATNADPAGFELVWQQVCSIEDIPRQGSRVIARHGAPNIAIFRTIHDTVFALVDECPHKKGPLSQGIVHGEQVTCPLHAWNIELATGNAVAPDQGCTQRVDVMLRGRVVFLPKAQLSS